MPVTIPSLDPLPLPAPPWFLWALLMLTFVLHLVAMNFVLGGSIIAVAARFREGGNSRRLAHWIGKLMPSAVATAVTFGVAPLLFVQALYGRLFFSSSVLMGWSWFAVVPILIVAYYGTYFLSLRGEKLGRTWDIAAFVAFLFVVVAFIYSNNMSMMLRPANFFGRYIADPRGLHLNASDITLLPRFLHMLFGAVAVAGVFVAIYGLAVRRSDEAHGRWATRHGALWFGASTALSVLTGAWWTAVLPGSVMKALFGGNRVAATIFAIAIIAAIAAWILMILAVNAAEPAKLVARSGEALVVALIAMVLTRDSIRDGMLNLSQFHFADRIDPQWGVIAIFAVLLLAALGTTAWMVTILAKSKDADA